MTLAEPRAISASLRPGWALTTLGAVTEERVRQAPPEGNGPFVYVDITSVDNRSKRITEPKVLPVAQAPSRARQHLRDGDVLVSMTRPNLNAVARVPGGLDGAVGSTGFHVLRPRSADSGWLYYVVQSPTFVEAMSTLVQGALYPAVRPKDVRAFGIALPPLDEQRRIVAALDATLGRLDAARARLQRVPEILKRYRASLLKAACEGRLVPTEAELARAEDRDYGPADALLARILEERRAKWEEAELAKYAKAGKPPPANWRAKYKEPAPFDASNLSELADGWCWAALDGLILDGPQNGLYKPANAYGGGVPIVRIDDYQDQFLRSRSKLRQLRLDDAEVELYGLAPGDLLINRVNSLPYLGKCLVVPESLCPAVFESNMMRLKLSPGVPAKWAAFCMREAGGRRRLVASAKLAINQASINQSDVRSMPIPLPPLAEQRRIVAAVERQLSAAERIEAAAAANLRRCERMREAVLAKAFRGELM